MSGSPGDQAVRLARRLAAPVRVVLLDGRSGSGKTALAAALAREWSAHIVHLDDLYPGWGGLRAGALRVAELFRTGRAPRYDWLLGRDQGQIRLPSAGRVVVEGCGALTDASLRAAAAWSDSPVIGVWLECPAGVRRRRALARDGDRFRPHWDSWAAQEEELASRERPLARAADVIHTA